MTVLSSYLSIQDQDDSVVSNDPIDVSNNKLHKPMSSSDGMIGVAVGCRVNVGSTLGTSVGTDVGVTLDIVVGVTVG
jgi:hypothetical protein